MLIKKWLNIFAVCILTSVSMPVLSDHKFKDELDSGKVVVFIINMPKRSESELYADWSHYLNQFSSEVGKEYVFHQVSKNKLKDLIQDSEKYSKAYSMIFMKKDKSSYFYNGPIVESQVYQFVRLAYQGKPIEPEYLNQFSPQEVNIKFKKYHN